jgi:glycine/D-amino acid oxidase-like deaminating enzyme
MVALRAPSVPIERVLWSERVYIVPRNDGRLVAGSTVEYAGFEKGLTPAGLQEILSAAMEIAPALKDAAIEETWSGLRPDSPDHLPILGPTDLDGLLVATGHFRSGILLAPVTAKLIREWITGQGVSINWEAFSPMRFLAAQRAAEEHTQKHQSH